MEKSGGPGWSEIEWAGNRPIEGNTMAIWKQNCSASRTLKRFNNIPGGVVKCFVPGNVYSQAR